MLNLSTPAIATPSSLTLLLGELLPLCRKHWALALAAASYMGIGAREHGRLLRGGHASAVAHTEHDAMA